VGRAIDPFIERIAFVVAPVIDELDPRPMLSSYDGISVLGTQDLRGRSRAWPGGRPSTSWDVDTKKKGVRGGNMVSPALYKLLDTASV
jgi:hypothetical protein